MNPGNGIETFGIYSGLNQSHCSFKLMNPGNGIETTGSEIAKFSRLSFQINEYWQRD